MWQLAGPPVSRQGRQTRQPGRKIRLTRRPRVFRDQIPCLSGLTQYLSLEEAIITALFSHQVPGFSGQTSHPLLGGQAPVLASHHQVLGFSDQTNRPHLDGQAQVLASSCLLLVSPCPEVPVQLRQRAITCSNLIRQGVHEYRHQRWNGVFPSDCHHQWLEGVCLSHPSKDNSHQQLEESFSMPLLNTSLRRP